MAIYKNTPPIVTNGLVLHLDAGNRMSYVSGSTTWNDLSGLGNNGTLTSGPTFNSDNQGNIVFNAANNQFINLGNILNYTTENFTFSYWVNFNSLTTNQTGQGPIILFKGAVQQNGYYDQIDTGAVVFYTNQSGAVQFSFTSAGIITIQTWYNISYVRNGSSIRIYVNGIDATRTAGTHVNPSSSTNNFTLSQYRNPISPGPSFDIHSNARLANFMNYNRALSVSEISQNYNALKSRFGLT